MIAHIQTASTFFKAARRLHSRRRIICFYCFLYFRMSCHLTTAIVFAERTRRIPCSDFSTAIVVSLFYVGGTLSLDVYHPLLFNPSPISLFTGHF
ncbi:hypothetical protein A0H81_14510 [Grifola frondosa]|uniref:Uncharacterized protein n=1 Tax=Grifola frondosa TaxID=5627 RepID=A0A1C7LLD9_GRIFR|nr:hypothetical protein A0H81_14510 [Grifola frondosa]